MRCGPPTLWMAISPASLLAAIEGEGGGGIRLLPGDRSAAVEHVIGGKMDQRYPLVRRPSGNGKRGGFIHEKCEVAFVLGLVDGRIGGGIDDYVRRQLVQARGDLAGLESVSTRPRSAEMTVPAGERRGISAAPTCPVTPVIRIRTVYPSYVGRRSICESGGAAASLGRSSGPGSANRYRVRDRTSSP